MKPIITTLFYGSAIACGAVGTNAILNGPSMVHVVVVGVAGLIGGASIVISAALDNREMFARLLSREKVS